jgi:hypothetical protein
MCGTFGSELSMSHRLQQNFGLSTARRLFFPFLSSFYILEWDYDSAFLENNTYFLQVLDFSGEI